MKKAKRNVLIKLLALIFCVMSFAAFVSCSGNSGGYKWTLREEAENNYDMSGYSALPRAKGETQKTVKVLDMDDYDNNDLFFALSLQGLLNRENPSVYIVHDEVVENLAGINASEFWLEQLDKDEYDIQYQESAYRLLVDNLDKIDGYILYDKRLADASMSTSPVQYNNLYGDNALLNLTVMLCAQKNAVALTREQLKILREEYGINADESNVNLPRLGDTTEFMLKDSNGAILSTPEARASTEVWEKVYEYALRFVAPDMNDGVMAHGPAFQAANYDYYIQHKVFLYNRIMTSDANEKQRNMESSIFGVTKPNTPMMGVQYLQLDEHSLVSTATQHYKYSVCAYETFNLSWSCGLPIVTPPQNEERDLQYDPDKIYISFDFSEGDNYSYHSMRVPLMGDNSESNIPIGWPIASTMSEIAPNIVEYYYKIFGDYDCAICPEAGPGYVFSNPPSESNKEFFAITSEYLKRNNTDTIRMLKADMRDPLPYAENVEGLNAMLIGYMGEFSDQMYNSNENANFLYRDTVFFRHYDGTAVDDIINYNGSYPAFFAVGMYGWNQDVNSVKTIAESLDDRFVVVTPSEMAELYKQYASEKFDDLDTVNLVPDGNADEMGFLYYAKNHNAIETGASGAVRYADGDEYFIYRFDLADDVESATLYLKLSGRFDVEVSRDNREYARVIHSEGYFSDVQDYEIDITKFLKDNSSKNVYVRFSDPTPENADGAMLHSLNIMTDKSYVKAGTINTDNDKAYLVDDSSEVNNYGRKGKFTYKLNIANTVSSPLLTVSWHEDKGVTEFSTDNKNFFTPTAVYNLTYSDIYDISEYSGKTLYVRYTNEKAIVSHIKISELVSVKEAAFSPNGNSSEEKFLISGDNVPRRAVDGTSSYSTIEGGGALIYRFALDSKITDIRLDLNISGSYKVSVSADYGQFVEVLRKSPDNSEQYRYINISDKITGGKVLCVKFELLDAQSDTAMRLYGVRLYTNLASDAMREIYERERKADIIFTPELGEQKSDARFWTSDTESAEYKLLDKDITDNDHIFKNGNLNMRCLESSDSVICYKLDFSGENAAFWAEYGIDVNEAFTKLRLDIDIAENYRISISSDNGANWEEVYVTALPSNYGGGAANRANKKLDLTEAYAENKVILVKITCPVTTAHTTLISGLYFYFN